MKYLSRNKRHLRGPTSRAYPSLNTAITAAGAITMQSGILDAYFPWATTLVAGSLGYYAISSPLYNDLISNSAMSYEHSTGPANRKPSPSRIVLLADPTSQQHVKLPFETAKYYPAANTRSKVAIRRSSQQSSSSSGSADEGSDDPNEQNSPRRPLRRNSGSDGPPSPIPLSFAPIGNGASKPGQFPSQPFSLSPPPPPPPPPPPSPGPTLGINDGPDGFFVRFPLWNLLFFLAAMFFISMATLYKKRKAQKRTKPCPDSMLVAAQTSNGSTSRSKLSDENLFCELISARTDCPADMELASWSFYDYVPKSLADLFRSLDWKPPAYFSRQSSVGNAFDGLYFNGLAFNTSAHATPPGEGAPAHTRHYLLTEVLAAHTAFVATTTGYLLWLARQLGCEQGEAAMEQVQGIPATEAIGPEDAADLEVPASPILAQSPLYEGEVSEVFIYPGFMGNTSVDQQEQAEDSEVFIYPGGSQADDSESDGDEVFIYPTSANPDEPLGLNNVVEEVKNVKAPSPEPQEDPAIDNGIRASIHAPSAEDATQVLFEGQPMIIVPREGFRRHRIRPNQRKRMYGA